MSTVQHTPPPGWRPVPDGDELHLHHACGQAVITLAAAIPVPQTMPGFLEDLVAAAAGASDVAPVSSDHGLHGIACRIALPGATLVRRELVLLYDDGWLYPVRLDHRGDDPALLADFEALVRSLRPRPRAPRSVGHAVHWAE